MTPSTKSKAKTLTVLSPPTMAKQSFNVNLDHFSYVSYCAMISITAVFLWMALTPNFPCFHLTSFNVTSLRTNTGAELTATFNVSGVLGNPNIVLSLWYESLDLRLSFDGHAISSAPVEPLPFSTGAETDTPVRVRFGVTRRPFPKGVVKGITEQRRCGSVRFGVTLLGRVRFTGANLRTRVHPLKLECYPLKVVFSSNSNGTGRLVAPADCFVV